MAKIKLTCEQCGKDFYDYVRKNNRMRKFCSTECGYENKRRRTIINCEHCNKEVEVKTFDIKRGKGRFCSKRCSCLANVNVISKRFKGKKQSYESRKKRSEATKGEKGHNWQGGKKSESMVIRSSFEMKEWRTAVFERDDFTCQLCGERGGRLNAHHIFSFAEYPDDRFVVDNGSTLCKDCHDIMSSIQKMGDTFQPLPRINHFSDSTHSLEI